MSARAAACLVECAAMQVTRATLAADLRALGVEAGRVVMVHASLRRIGATTTTPFALSLSKGSATAPFAQSLSKGGADAVIDALLDVIGADGTLLMVLGSNDDAAPFDPATTPADPTVGAMAEVFRCRAGVLVNDHVAARYAAQGPHAAWLLGPQPLHHYYGSGSVLERLTHINGRVLRFGADIDTVTLTHHAEYLAQLPHKYRVVRDYVRADTGALQVESLDDSDGIVDWPHGDYFAQLMRDWLAGPRVREGTVGRAQAELFDAQPFVDFAVRWMEINLLETSRLQGTNERR